MILRAGAVAPERVEGSSPRLEAAFGKAAGLALLGVNIVTLAPGTRSALRHWHSDSDEFVLILEGQATVVENDGETVIGPGDMALWPAGVPNAHQIWNRGAGDLRYLCAGTNPEAERVHYPDDRQVLHWQAPHWRVEDAEGRVIRQGTA